MRSYIERAQSFVEDIFGYIEESLEYENFGVNFTSAIERYCEEKHRLVSIESGMSRTVLITSDYVIKIDRNVNSFCGDSEDEVRAYQFACDNGFDHLFAEITRFKYGGYNFYIMPRVSGINPYRDDEEMYSYLTEEEADFVDEYFSDLHSGNFGITKGKIIITDYAWNSIV